MIHLTPMFHGFGLAQPGFVGLTFVGGSGFDDILPVPGGARPGDLILALSARTGSDFGGGLGAGWTSIPGLPDGRVRLDVRLLSRTLEQEAQFNLGWASGAAVQTLLAVRAAALKGIGDIEFRSNEDATTCIAPGVEADGNGREVAVACFFIRYGSNMTTTPNNDPAGLWMPTGPRSYLSSFPTHEFWISSVLPAGTTPTVQQEVTLGSTPTTSQTDVARSLGFQILLERPA